MSSNGSQRKKQDKISSQEQRDPVDTATIFWLLGLVSVLPIIIPEIFRFEPLLSLATVLVASVTFIIIGAFYYRNKIFATKEEIKKSLRSFRIAYAISWILLAVAVTITVVFIKTCFSWDCLSVLIAPPIIATLFTYAVTFTIISLKLKKKLSQPITPPDDFMTKQHLIMSDGDLEERNKEKIEQVKQLFRDKKKS